MGEYNKYQGLNIGSGITYVPTGRFPIVGGNVFESYNDLINYINSPTSTAIGGTILFVVSDEDSTKNGVYEIRFKNTNRDNSGKIPYFVNGESNLEAIKLGEGSQYTAGDGISIENNEIKVKIANDNSNALHVNENGELFVSQSENPESVKYEAGNSIEISDDNKINVIVSESENNILTFDENGKLFVPQQEIPESVEYTDGQGITISDDNKINVKVSTTEGNSLTIDENGLFVPQVEMPEIPEQIEYTAGQGVEISESNEINVVVSESKDNILAIDENGKLFVPQPKIPESVEYTAGQGVEISESNEINVKISTSENNSLTFDENGKLFVPQVEIPEVEQYNVTSLDTDNDFVKIDVTKNDESKQFELKTSIKTVSLFDLPENVNGLATARDIIEYIAFYVQKTLNERHPDAEVYYDDVNDTLATNKVDGTIGPDDIQAIEDYIDNSDMGKY